jgi:hypothetical protein
MFYVFVLAICVVGVVDGVTPGVVGCYSDLGSISNSLPDGEVNSADLFVLLANWNGVGPTGDLDRNGNVNSLDLFRLLSDWGICTDLCTSCTFVPSSLCVPVDTISSTSSVCTPPLSMFVNITVVQQLVAKKRRDEMIRNNNVDHHRVPTASSSSPSSTIVGDLEQLSQPFSTKPFLAYDGAKSEWHLIEDEGDGSELSQTDYVDPPTKIRHANNK